MFRPLDDPLRLLTRDRAAQLRWLDRQYGASFSEHDLEELLQDAYVRAMASLDGAKPPRFEAPAELAAWFRAVMGNTATDAVRSRDGRTDAAKAARPVIVPLAVDDDEPLIADEDLETRLVEEAERDHVQVAVVRAMAELPDEYQRVLQRRFVENRDPRAIVEIERLESLKVYEGRLTRAVKALGRALARLELGVGCREAKHLLEQRPDLLLERAAGSARVHLDACAACMAFSRRLRGALAALPTPALGLATAGAAPAAAPAKPGLLHAALAHPKLVAVMAAGALAGGGGALTVTSGESGAAAAAGNRARPQLRCRLLPRRSLTRCAADVVAKTARSCCERVLFRDARLAMIVRMPRASAICCRSTVPEGRQNDNKPDVEVARRAGEQWGVLSLDDLYACGLSSKGVTVRVRNGRLHRLHRGVYAVGHARPPLQGRWLAAVKACGPSAVLSHFAAAALLGILAWEERHVDVTVTGTAARRVPGLRVHRATLGADERERHRGLPVTSPVRTLLDLASVLPERPLRRAVGQAQSLRLVHAAQLAGAVQRSGRRHGLVTLARIVAAGPAPTRSELEDVVLTLIAHGGLARPDVNVALRLAGRRVVPDFRWPKQRLVVEADGAAWHDHRIAREDDAQRQALLERHGERVVRVTWEQAVHRPDETLARLRAAGAPPVG